MNAFTEFAETLAVEVHAYVERRLADFMRDFLAAHKAVEAPAPRDGTDGRDGIDGKDGRDGIDGKDGVDGINGKDGVDGINGKDGVDGINGKDGRDGTDRAILDLVTVRDALPRRGQIKAVSGGLMMAVRDAVGGPDTDPLAYQSLLRGIEGAELTHTDDVRRREFTLRYSDGTKTVMGLTIPNFKHVGTWERGKQIIQGDVVTWNGCCWVASVDAPDHAPGEGANWSLLAKRGPAGRPGDKGAKGDKGDPGIAKDGVDGKDGKDGKDGVGIANITAVAGMVVLSLTDGREFAIPVEIFQEGETK